MNKKYVYSTIGMLSLVMAIAAATASSTAPSITDTTYQTLEGESITINTAAFTGTPAGFNAVTSSTAGSACACTVSTSKLDMTSSIPLVRMNAHTENNWAYQFTVKEAGVNTVTAGTTYKVELFKDGVSQAVVYIDNATEETTAVEGVRGSFDVGATAPSGNMWEIKVTAV